MEQREAAFTQLYQMFLQCAKLAWCQTSEMKSVAAQESVILSEVV